MNYQIRFVNGGYLKNIKENFEIFFSYELLESVDILPSNEFGKCLIV